MTSVSRKTILAVVTLLFATRLLGQDLPLKADSDGVAVRSAPVQRQKTLSRDLAMGNHPKTIKPPGAIFAIAEGVNDGGQIVGYFTDKSRNTHGFLFNGGAYQNIDFPGALYTFVTGISNSGEIVGNYQDAIGRHGFTLNNGTYVPFDIPGAQWIQVQGVNDQGWLAGIYGPANGGSAGFFWDGNVIRNITYPGTGTTSPFGINAAGDIVGQFDSNGGTRDGFIYHDGAYSLVTLPGVQLSQDIHYIEAIGINNRGDIAGSYIDANNFSRAFDLKAGAVTTIQLDGARGFGVNNDERVVGEFSKQSVTRGFTVVAKAVASVTLSSSQNPSNVNQLVTFTAVVSGRDATPTGSVSFKHGTEILGTVTLDSGRATFSMTFTRAGKFPIIASYSGDSNYFSGKSSALKQVVMK